MRVARMCVCVCGAICMCVWECACVCVPDQLLIGIQVVLAGHHNTEDVPPHVRVHSLLPGLLQHLGTELVVGGGTQKQSAASLPAGSQ